MRLQICYDKNLGVSNQFLTLTLENGKIIDKKLLNCKDSPFEILEDYLVYKDLKIPLIYRDERHKLARILFVLLGKTKHEIFYYRKAQIFIDVELSNLRFENLKRSYTKMCGNYGSTKLSYCITNGEISIISPSKEEAEEALNILKDFIRLLSEINNSV